MAFGSGRMRRIRGRRSGPSAESLRAAQQAFSPAGAGPVDPKDTQRNISRTRQAVERIARERGVSRREAVTLLTKTAQQIKERDRIMRESKAKGRSKLQTAAAVHKAGVPKELLEVRSFEFQVPEGKVIQTSLPGGEKKVKVRPRRTAPSRAPSPSSGTPTPRRRY